MMHDKCADILVAHITFVEIQVHENLSKFMGHNKKERKKHM
jgi:hypothetical protein